MRAVLYVRVSTRDQNPETQLQDLRRYAAARGFEVVAEIVDIGVSGAKERRPGLDRVMALARGRALDAVLVAGFDRFGRSVAHLVRALEEFRHLGVGFVSLREQIDLGSPTGRVMFAVIAAMAEFERELVRERIQAGLRRARAQGKRLGRPPRVYHRDRVLPLRQAGRSVRKIAQELGISRRAVQRALRGGAKSSC
ncbi:MAG: recombinase family protein [Acidobacteria bacterium]|nr:recombinase family protein [Acidobacteriota bacterium]